MKPGTSDRKISGMLNASHSCTKCVALSAESTNSTPPLNSELLPTTPTTWPSSRPNPTSTSRAQPGWISNSDPSSSSAAAYRRMSNACRSEPGTSARRSPLPGPAAGATGGRPVQLAGR